MTNRAVMGEPLPGWTPRDLPPHTGLMGRYCHVERLLPAIHGAELYAAFSHSRDNSDWDFLPYGPFRDSAAFAVWLDGVAAKGEEGDSAVEASVKQRVHALTERFPIYG